jgi:hypothetical protein
MKKRRVFRIGLAIILFIVTLTLYNQFTEVELIYNSNKKSEIQISSEELISLFHENENRANSVFVGKMIEAKGVIKKITYQNDTFTIFLKGENESSYVICVMQTDQHSNVNQMVLGQSIVLKGICKGFLNDVIFFGCIIVKS